jgi:transposase-like protein
MGKRYKAEEIVMKLREIELSINQGMDVVHACRQTGISDQSYNRWRKEYGGMKIDQAKRYKELEQENAYKNLY